MNAADAPMEEHWFLGPGERGNPATGIQPWTLGNRVDALVHGRSYFPRLLRELQDVRRGDLVALTDWRGDPDQQLDGPGTELGDVLAAAAGRGVEVRCLLWRSHPARAHFNEEPNLHLGAKVNHAGGQVLLDERVRGAGCQHQKLVVLRHAGRIDHDVAFVGGIDLCHGRGDDERHLGDPQPPPLDPRYGARPPWHDAQVEIRGPAVGDLMTTFRERWEDPTPLDHRNPWRARLARRVGQPRHPRPLPERLPDPGPAGPHAVQVLRTYPAKRPRLPFAPEGERSVARAYAKAFGRAPAHLRRGPVPVVQGGRPNPGRRAAAFAVAARDRGGASLPGPGWPALRPAQPHRPQAAIDLVRAVGGDRVAVYDLENDAGTPIYVHAKVCVIDDVWAAVGSDNLNRRSWTHDSELAAAVLDPTRDSRAPQDPAGLGDGARVFARELRLGLWREHLARAPGDDGDLLDLERGFQAWREQAAALEAWHRRGGTGARPPGRVMEHQPGRVRPWAAWWAWPLYRTVVDPDGRPWRLRRAGTF